MLSIFQSNHCHLAVVTMEPLFLMDCMKKGIHPTREAAMLGIVTLEDVIEKIIQNEITDETDALKRPSVYPNGGAPIFFYHGMVRSAESRPIRSRYSDPVAPRSPSRRLNNLGSVVTAEYLNSTREQYSKRKEDLIYVNKEGLFHDSEDNFKEGTFDGSPINNGISFSPTSYGAV